MKNISKVSILVLALSAAGLAQAAPTTTAGQSTSVDITVGGTNSTSPNHPRTNGAPGVGITEFHEGAMVSFSGLTNMVSADSNSMYTITPAMMPSSHSELGYFDFAQVSGSEVFFGEWSENGTSNDPTRTVYYAGESQSTTIPTSGAATYNVAGINDYNGSNLLTGTLNANFGTGDLSGSLSRTGLNMSIDASIDAANARFNGTATATTSSGPTKGASVGHFFGANAEALSGITTFNDRNLDTAFGGSKVAP